MRVRVRVTPGSVRPCTLPPLSGTQPDPHVRFRPFPIIPPSSLRMSIKTRQPGGPASTAAGAPRGRAPPPPLASEQDELLAPLLAAEARVEVAAHAAVPASWLNGGGSGSGSGRGRGSGSGGGRNSDSISGGGGGSGSGSCGAGTGLAAASVKVDGSLIIAFVWEGELRATTRRRMTSEQVGARQGGLEPHPGGYETIRASLGPHPVAMIVETEKLLGHPIISGNTETSHVSTDLP